ncbi:MAG TPA: BON domain-containing protein [Burkholderiales bacterium]|nr:BON domain-containing protein [Burkholderiales bacterium]
MNANRRNMMGAVLGAAVLALAACTTNPENKRTTGETAGDAAVTAKVKTAIATDVGARTASVVNVNTYNGVVQLTGFVDNEEQKKQAEAAAKQVDGVKSVKNDIRIKG